MSHRERRGRARVVAGSRRVRAAKRAAQRRNLRRKRRRAVRPLRQRLGGPKKRRGILKSLLFGVQLPAGERLITGTVPIGGAALGALRGIGRGIKGLGRFLAPKTPKQALGVFVGGPVLVGALTSPKVRSFFDPRRTFKKGKALGRLIEDPSRLLPKERQTPFGRAGEIAATAGLGAGAAALIAGLISRAKARKGQIPSAVLPAGILPATTALTPRTEPLGAVQREPEIEQIAGTPATIPDIRITNKPQINISFRKSRRFINQQLLIK